MSALGELAPILAMGAVGYALKDPILNALHGVHSTVASATSVVTPGTGSPSSAPTNSQAVLDFARGVGINITCAQAWFDQHDQQPPSGPNGLSDLNAWRKAQPPSAQCCDNPPC